MSDSVVCCKDRLIRWPRFDIVAASTKVDLELYQEIYAAFQKISSNITEATNGDATMQISLQPVTTHAVLLGRSLGGNALNLSAQPQQCEC